MSPTTILGTTLADRYRIERQIGVGGMATVYLARDVKHERGVALKVLKPDIAAVLGVDRFLSEIKVTAQLQHPNLLPLFDSGEAGGMLYYVMPYVEGESLRAKLEREKQLPVEHAVHIATAVASALDYAHAQGVIHRDLKPENILMQSGEPVVADFGIALAVSKAGGARVTQTGVSLGTPQYMSPEQATGDRQIDARADIYALGAVLYEMLTGEPPHTGGSIQAIFARIIADRPQSIHFTRPSVPDHVVFAVERALEKLPADRWTTARDFAAALSDRALSGVSVSRGASRASQPSRFSRLTIGTVVVAITALTLVGAWGWVRALERREPGVVAFKMDFPAEAPLAGTRLPLAVSADGQVIAYTATVDNKRHLFVRRLDELRGRRLEGTVGAVGPVFSPDGRWIAFISENRLRRVAAAGGPTLELSADRIATAAWTRKGSFVVGLARSPKQAPVLGIVPAAGGNATPLTKLDSAAGEQSHRWPSVLEDDETILFTVWPKTGIKDARIGVASLETGSTTALDLRGIVALGVIDDHLIYVGDDGTIRAVPFDFSARKTAGAPVPLIQGLLVGGGGATSATLSASGTLVYIAGTNETQIMVVDRSGGSRALLTDMRRYHTPRVSPDGRRIAMAIGQAQVGDIWVYDIPTATLSRLTNDSASWYPEWTADGRQVLYNSLRDTTVRTRPVDGSAVPRSIISDGKFHYFTAHPDGRRILYTVFPDSGEGTLWIRDLEGGGAPTPVQLNSDAWTYRFSPDGRWLAYQSYESGTDQVYVRPFPGPGPRVQVSTTYGTEPVWSRDGRRIYYRDGQKLMAATMQLSPTLEVRSRSPLFDDPYDHWWDVAAYDVTPDDNFVLVRRPTENQHVVVIANWRQQLRDRLRERR